MNSAPSVLFFGGVEEVDDVSFDLVELAVLFEARFAIFNSPIPREVPGH
jgi:hypothetical protein